MHSKDLLQYALQNFGVGKCSLQKTWSEQLSTPIFLGLKFVHSKILPFLEWNGVHSNFCWSGLQVHSKNFGVNKMCTPEFRGNKNWSTGNGATNTIHVLYRHIQPIPFFLRGRGTPPDQFFLQKKRHTACTARHTGRGSRPAPYEGSATACGCEQQRSGGVGQR
jgi:hypothetical protein